MEVAASGRGEYFGFSIDGNRRFMLPDFTVTHNTAVAVGMQVAERQAFGRRSLNMVVVPQNICMQWRDEIAKFAGDLLAVHMVVGYADLNLLTGPAALSKFDVLLTTPSFFVTLAEFCEQYQVAPRRVIVDEADTICNMISRQIPGAMTWFLSATMDRLPESKAAMVQIGKYVTGVEDLNAPADGQNSVRTRSGGVLRAQEYGTYEIPARLLRSGERVCRCEPGWIARGFGIPSPTAKTIVCSNVIIDMLACLTFARLETDTARLLQPQQLESANARDFRNLRTGVVTDDEFLLVPALLRRHVANGAEAKDNLASLAGVVNMEQRAAECKAQAALAAEYVAVIRENAAKTLLCQATFEQLALPDRGKPPVERCYACPACGAGYCAPWAEAHAGHPCLRCGSDEALVERTLGPPALAVNKVTRLAETIRAVAGSEGRQAPRRRLRQVHPGLLGAAGRAGRVGAGDQGGRRGHAAGRAPDDLRLPGRRGGRAAGRVQPLLLGDEPAGGHRRLLPPRRAPVHGGADSRARAAAREAGALPAVDVPARQRAAGQTQGIKPRRPCTMWPSFLSDPAATPKPKPKPKQPRGSRQRTSPRKKAKAKSRRAGAAKRPKSR